MTHKERYLLAGDAAAEIARILEIKPTHDDINLWAFYCYHFNISQIHDAAYRCVSLQHQREIDNAVTSFQRWLSNKFPKKGGAK